MLNQQARELIQEAIELLSVASISQSTIDNATNLIKTACESIKNKEDININEVPYISTYYIKPIVEVGEEAKLDFYITDYFHKEYLEDDYSETFTVTLRIEGREDKKFYNLKAGDHTISLGKFDTEGEKEFSILCTDKYGRNSHELFNFFLVRNEPVVNEYVMTEEDLKTYNIKNDDDYEQKIYVLVDKLTDTTVGTKIEEVANATVVPSKKYICFIGTTETDENNNPIMQTKPARFWLNTIVKYANDYDKAAVLQEATNTRIGIQKLLDDKKIEGYNKVKLLSGTYRLDNWNETNSTGKYTQKETIYIPTEFTLDMNGATFKQNQFTGISTLMLALDSTFDSHVINGIIEGDYFSHDYTNSPSNPEWCKGIYISGSSKYSSFENIIIQDITGYGGGNSLSQKSGFTYFSKSIGDIFTLGDINLIDGTTINSTNRQTTSFIDISSYIQYEYIALNKYLGYQGILGESWNLIYHFYDSNQNYIKSIPSYQYRLTKIPLHSKFMKVTILSSTSNSNFYMVYFKFPHHCWIKNTNFKNCRCIGLAQAQMSHMLIEDCEFSLNGQSGAFCALDAEDGWDGMQDVTYRRLNFHDNYRNDFLTCAGHNFIIENMINGSISFGDRTNSYVVRNCANLSGAALGRSSRERTGYVRFNSNSINNTFKIDGTDDYPWKLAVKNSIINARISLISLQDSYINCKISGTLTSTNSTGGGQFINCYIHDITTNTNGNINYYNCTIENISGSLQNNHIIYNCKLINFNKRPFNNSTINIINSSLTNSCIILDYWKTGSTILIDNCTINNIDYLLKLPHYAMCKTITISNNKFDSIGKNGMVYFYDDRINSSIGELYPQDILYLINNIITLNNSQYVIAGLSSTTINDINIVSSKVT